MREEVRRHRWSREREDVFGVDQHREQHRREHGSLGVRGG
jgi:hypothetical protein